MHITLYMNLSLLYYSITILSGVIWCDGSVMEKDKKTLLVINSD